MTGKELYEKYKGKIVTDIFEEYKGLVVGHDDDHLIILDDDIYTGWDYEQMCSDDYIESEYLNGEYYFRYCIPEIQTLQQATIKTGKGITFTEYQERIRKTAVYPEHLKVLYPSLGLSGETGEVCEKIKKVFRDKGGEFSEESVIEIKKELGDVLWYIQALCNDLGLDLEDVALSNIEKLESRKERGKINGNGDNR